MAFTDLEIAEHTLSLEQHFWAHRRPPLHLRDKVREGQRFTDQSIELFIVRPAFNRPGEHTEGSIAKVLTSRKDVMNSSGGILQYQGPTEARAHDARARTQSFIALEPN